MPYFKPFPYINYAFPDGDSRLYKNLSIRPGIADELLNDESNLQVYYVESGETPETIAFDLYGDENMHWIIMLTNNIMNLYTDWPMNDDMFKEYLYEKYRTQLDSDGVERTLSDDQVYEFISFVGLPDNNYQSYIEDTSGWKILIRPHHFEDEDGDEYAYHTFSQTTDAFGRTLVQPTLTPVSYEQYELNLNDTKKQIYLPSRYVANKMKAQFGNIVNE